MWPFDVLVVTVYVDPDYRYTVRCMEDGDPIWILSRTPDMDEEVYAGLVRRLASMGIHPSVCGAFRNIQIRSACQASWRPASKWREVDTRCKRLPAPAFTHVRQSPG